MTTSLSDELLAHALASGEDGALEELMNRYQKHARGWAFKCSENESETEEIMQNIWVTLWRKAGQFEGRSSFKSWFYMICKTEALMFARYKTFRAGRYDLLQSDEIIEKRSSQEEQVYFAKVLSFTNARLMKMREKTRDAITGHFLYSEAAIRPVTKSRVRRGRLALIEGVSRDCGEDIKEAVNF